MFIKTSTAFSCADANTPYWEKWGTKETKVLPICTGAFHPDTAIANAFRKAALMCEMRVMLFRRTCTGVCSAGWFASLLECLLLVHLSVSIV